MGICRVKNRALVAPLRVRELKRRQGIRGVGLHQVAPLRVRELKLRQLEAISQFTGSHPYGCVS